MKPQQRQATNSRGSATRRGHRVQGPVVARCRSLVLNHPALPVGPARGESGVWELARRAGRMLDGVGPRLFRLGERTPGVGERTPESRDTKTPPDVRSVAVRRQRPLGRPAPETRVSPRGASAAALTDEERMRFKAG